MQLPFDPETYHPDPSGLRLGVQEVTRQGMKERDMKRVAEFIRMILINKKKPSKIILEIEDFLRSFKKIQYSFD
jgi:glycine hydroxymethyltransferase